MSELDLNINHCRTMVYIQWMCFGYKKWFSSKKIQKVNSIIRN